MGQKSWVTHTIREKTGSSFVLCPAKTGLPPSKLLHWANRWRALIWYEMSHPFWSFIIHTLQTPHCFPSTRPVWNNAKSCQWVWLHFFNSKKVRGSIPSPLFKALVNIMSEEQKCFLLQQTILGCGIAWKLWIRCCTAGGKQAYDILNNVCLPKNCWFIYEGEFKRLLFCKIWNKPYCNRQFSCNDMMMTVKERG